MLAIKLINHDIITVRNIENLFQSSLDNALDKFVSVLNKT